MRITALVKSHDHVCCRYRAAAFRAHLEELGHSVDIRPWSSPWFLRQMLLPSFLNGIDVLIIQRKLFPAWQLNLLRRRVRWLIYDFDDSIFLRSSYNPRGQDCPKRFSQFRHMVQTADVVIAGNDYLRDQATALTEPDKVHLIPTCVDVSRYPLARHEAPSRVKLAWIGSSSTIRGLEKIRDILDRLGKGVPQLELKVICDRSLLLDHLPVDFRPWQEATETAELADSAIGISWLPDDGWSAGKCGLKVLQYMAAGLPVVANPVGMQKKLVRPGETGFLVETPQEWEDAVTTLANDASLRRRMGLAGRRLVEAEYQVSRGAAAWELLIGRLRRSKSEITCDR
jgi:glycosyltransferase involved in cell wall biosynthesis